jgi:hypothetical protein
MRMHQVSSLTLAAVAMLVSAAPAQAAFFTYTGTTAGGPTYNRLFEDLSGQSPNGTGVRYNALTFSVTVPGSYSFLTTSGGYDSFAFLYGPSFAPATPLLNALVGNDDLIPGPPYTTSGFSFTLAAGTPYVFINTGFASTDFGAFSTTIGGPGNVIAAIIPEPAGYALLAMGLAAVGLARQRRMLANA